MSETRILFVCLGNICRSPVAEGVFAHIANEAGYADRFMVDSAGTGAWHVGKPPDRRAQAAAAARGIDLTGIRARQVRARDFADFDLILGMDMANLADLLALAPEAHADKVGLFLDGARGLGTREVPDPYFGRRVGFETMFDLVEAGSRALLARLL